MKKLALSIIILSIISMSFNQGSAAPASEQLYYTKTTNLSGGQHILRFSLWTVGSGGTEVSNMPWWEMRTMNLTSGVITTYLGSVTAPGSRSGLLGDVDFSQQYWVQIDEVSGTAPNYIYTPVGTRTKLNMVPYAMHSITSENAAAGGSVPSVTAGSGLTSTTSVDGDVTLNVGAGAGIVVGPDAVGIKVGGVTTSMLAAGAVTDSKITGPISAAKISQGTGSTLDADTVDGKHAGYFSAATHNHNSTYVNVTGDTMTGNLTAPSIILSGNITLPATTSSTGQILFGTETFIHNYGATNTFVGVGAGNFTMIDGMNTGLGYSSLPSNTDGYHNIAVGTFSLFSNTTGIDNTSVGTYSMRSNTSGYANTAVGMSSLYANTTGTQNTALGQEALYAQSFSNGDSAWNADNTAVGYKALWVNNPDATSNGIQNTAVGSMSLIFNTVGSKNTAIGYTSLYSNTKGNFNVAAGHGSLYSNTSASNNIAIGRSALSTQSFSNSNSSWSSYNVAIGDEALFSNQPTASDNGVINTAIGTSSLYSNNTGAMNTALGANTLYNNSTGSRNTAVGLYAGMNQTTGNNNTYIGYNVRGVAGESDTIRIGDTATATYISGISGRTASAGAAVYVNAGGQLGTLTSSRRFKEDIKDMGDATDGLMKLRPVTFYYKPEYADGPRLLQYGLIAEEVEEVYPGLVQYNDNGQPNTVYYQFVNAMLLNEVQKQHSKIEAQQKEMDELRERLARIEAMMK